MTEADLRERLRAVQIDAHPDAEQRAWEVVRSVFDPAVVPGRRRRWRAAVPAVACAIGIAVIVLVTASAPREALARWIRQAIGFSAQPHPRPTLGPLPGGGRLLVDSPGGPWIVHPDGSRVFLGHYTAAAWSPHGLYVVAWRADRLAALDPQGHPHWMLVSDGPVTVARWSPDGYRIAYIAGRTLNIVAGDGSDQHPLAGGVKPVTPAWQPHTGPAHRIAFLDRRGDIELRNADTRALLWRVAPPVQPEQLLWSPDGTRLLAVAPHRLSVYTARGRLIAITTVESGATVGPAAFATGERIAVILHRVHPAADSVALFDAGRRGAYPPLPQVLFTAPEPLTGIDWSPNHQWLLTSSPAADQWIFVRVIAPTRFSATSDIARQFRPGGRRASGFPALAGWQP